MLEFLFFFILIFIFLSQNKTLSIKESFSNDNEINSTPSDPLETIFVSVASYRDEKCPQTLESLFSNADHPHRVFVGICQQNNKDLDKDCFLDKWKSQTRIIRLPYYDAKGPTWARYLCSTLWNNENYYLQIDSHTLFNKGWDTKLINMIKLLKNKGIKKPLLSHYPKIYDDYNNENGKETVPTICQSFFNDSKMISLQRAYQITIDPDNPIPTAYVAAGMFFCESSFLNEVPFDPNLPNLFIGEEILHSIRFWTHGWDIFTPTENVLYHYYTRKGEPKVWDDLKHYNSTDATNKVRNLLKLDNANEIAPYLNLNMEIYGLGNKRTIEQYFEYAGINVKDSSVSRNFCYDKNIHEIFEQFKY